MTAYVLCGNSLDVLRCMPDACIDAVVTDPPYELGFMGKKWDASGIAFNVELWAQVLRVMKPGAHLLAFSGTRTYHRMVCAIEDAGFEIRDQLAWMYGSGFPKSLDVSHELEGADGIGTALKPAQEPIVLARKPLVGTVAANVLAHGTGGLNIDACRIEGVKGVPASPRRAEQNAAYGELGNDPGTGSGWDANAGRWPANVILDEVAGEILDEQSGTVKGQQGRVSGDEPSDAADGTITGKRSRVPSGAPRSDTGGASRFFYCAKASRSEREAGLEAAGLPVRTAGELTDRVDGSDGLNSPRAGAGRGGGRRNHHPTVKPIDLMAYLVRLVTPPGGVVLDPFNGSGTTGVAAVREGVHYIGIDLSADYCAITRARIEHAIRAL